MGETDVVDGGPQDGVSDPAASTDQQDTAETVATGSSDGGDPTGATGTSSDPDPGGSTSADVTYDVGLEPQPDKTSCWAGSMAMLVGFRRQVSVSPEQVAEEAGQTLRRSYGWDELEAVRDHFGFQAIDLPSDASLYYQPQQWFDWLQALGPLWVTTVGNPSHAIVVAGIHGDLTASGTTVDILNPWDTRAGFDSDPIDFNPPNNGYQYSQTFADFAADFGNVGLNLPSGDWRVLYLPA